MENKSTSELYSDVSEWNEMTFSKFKKTDLQSLIDYVNYKNPNLKLKKTQNKKELIHSLLSFSVKYNKINKIGKSTDGKDVNTHLITQFAISKNDKNKSNSTKRLKATFYDKDNKKVTTVLFGSTKKTYYLDDKSESTKAKYQIADDSAFSQTTLVKYIFNNKESLLESIQDYSQFYDLDYVEDIAIRDMY